MFVFKIIFFLCSVLSINLFAASNNTAVQSHQISTGAGTSYPSISQSLENNVAGLMYAKGFTLFTSALTEDSKFNPFDADARMILGNGSLGGAFGVHKYKNGSQDKFAYDYGLGSYASVLNTAIGIGGRTKDKKDLVGGEDTYGLNLGLIYNPLGMAKLSFHAIGILQSPDFYTAGVASSVGDVLILTVDGSTDKDKKGTTIVSAFGIHGSTMQVSTGYGIKINQAGESYFKKGFTSALGINLGPQISLQTYYNHRAKYQINFIANF